MDRMLVNNISTVIKIKPLYKHILFNLCITIIIHIKNTIYVILYDIRKGKLEKIPGSLFTRLF